MKNKTPRNILLRFGLALALTGAVWSPSSLQSAEPMKGVMMDPKMNDSSHEMVGQNGKMMEELKQQDADMAVLVAKMNRAPDDKKLALLAVIVTKMAAQRATMHIRMEKMHDAMMNHMNYMRERVLYVEKSKK